MSTDHVSDLENQIEQTRAELAENVEALAHKADVPGRVKDKVGEVKEDVEARVAEAKATAEVKATEAKEKAKMMAGQMAGEKAGAAVIQLDAERDERPWLLPAIGAVAGLAVAGIVSAIAVRRRRASGTRRRRR